MTANLAQPLIQAIDAADSSDKLLDAVRALSAACLVEGAPTLITALGYNNPGVAVAAVEGLIAIGEPAVLPLLELLDDYNYSARAWAVRALAGIGDPRSLEVILEAAKNDFALSVRRAAARGLGTLKWHLIPSDRLATVQTQILGTLVLVCQDPEWIVQYAAVTALEALAQPQAGATPELITQVLATLRQMLTSEIDTAVRSRVLFALQKSALLHPSMQ